MTNGERGSWQFIVPQWLQLVIGVGAVFIALGVLVGEIRTQAVEIAAMQSEINDLRNAQTAFIRADEAERKDVEDERWKALYGRLDELTREIHGRFYGPRTEAPGGQ